MEEALKQGLSTIIAASLIAGGLAIALSAMFAALGQARAIAAGLEAIGRNPEAQSKIHLTMIIGLAFIESLALYALFISMKLVSFIDPIMKLLKH